MPQNSAHIHVCEEGVGAMVLKAGSNAISRLDPASAGVATRNGLQGAEMKAGVA